MIAHIMGWADGWSDSRDIPHEELRRRVKARGIEIGVRIFEDWPAEVNHANLTRNIMFRLDPDQMQDFFVRLVDLAIVREPVRLERGGWSSTRVFRQFDEFFEQMPGPFPPRVCEAGRAWLADYETRHDYGFTLCT